MRGFSPALLLGTQLLIGCTALVENELDKKSSSDAGASRDASERDADSTDVDAGTRPGDAGEPTDDDGGEVVPTGPADNDGARLTFGRLHVCAITDDGRVACWGENNEKQLDLPEGTYIDVAAGYDHTCAITTAGRLVCSGKNNAQQSTGAAGPFAQVTAGDLHTCVLSAEGVAQCFSKDNFDGLLDVPADQFSSIAAGLDFTCGIRKSDATMRCWGTSASGYQSGAQGLKFSALSASTGVVCGIQLTGEPTCFGQSVRLDITEPAAAISVSANGTCVLNEAGALLCGGRVDEDVNGRLSEAFRRGPYVSFAVSREFGVDRGALCAIPRQGPPACDSPNVASLLLVPTDLLP